VFDWHTARTYIVLALVVVASPIVGVLASTVGSRAARPPEPPARRTAIASPVAEPSGVARPVEPSPTVPPPGHVNTPVPSPTATAAPPLPSPTPAPSIFKTSQVIAFYGSPVSSMLGVLGRFPPDQLVKWLKGEAGIYDQINGDRGAVPALDLIYSQAQSEPTDNGLYVSYLPDNVVQSYITLAEQNDLQVILDLQVGRGDVADEVRKIERFLVNPRVHVAIDPEYAVGPYGVPVETPGTISGDEINTVQAYLEGLVERFNLPPKLLVIHQFMDQTIVNGGATRRYDRVDLVLNMDAYGAAQDKADKYHLFARRSYAEHRSFNVFLHLDDPVASEADVMKLTPQPDMVIYQ